MINVKMQNSETHSSLSPKIAVIGVGGAGGNAVNNMIASNLEGCEFLVCNTDAQALTHSLASNTLQLGEQITGGLGAGSKPEVGRAAAEESLEEMMEYLDGANMAFVTAGMGGGTGTGAAPVIAKACREKGILTVGVVTKPFHFEGSHRMRMAEAGLKEMQNYVDTLIVIPNQNLFRVANEKTTFADGFKMADSVLQSGVRGVTDLMVRPGLVNLDFADIRTAMLEMGKAMMGTGEASSDKRAIEAAEAAINNPLLDDVTMKGARGVIINVTGGYDMTLFEADEACNRIRDEVDPEANIIFGATFDEKMEGSMRVSIVATGIEREAARKETEGPSGEEKAPYKTGIDNVRGITAPTGTGPTGTGPTGTGPAATPMATTEPAAGAGAHITKAAHTGFSPPHSTAAEVSTQTSTQAVVTTTQITQQATASSQAAHAHLQHQGQHQEQARQSATAQAEPEAAMRGTRYKDAFIPPQPVMIRDKPETPHPSGIAARTHEHDAPQSPGHDREHLPHNAGLVLNPPKKSDTEAGDKPGSFFQRIAQSLHGTLARGEAHKQALGQSFSRQQGGQTGPDGLSRPAGASHAVSAPSLGSAALKAEGAPAQGQLNIDAPAAAPKAAQDDLDIPAFLRRQAN